LHGNCGVETQESLGQAKFQADGCSG
jgi:hypothetical protein